MNVNAIKQKAIEFAGNHIIPVIKDSKFAESGVLTPEEFVAAGDHLVHHCPTWQWAAGDSSKAKNYLPVEKQFLLTRSVPCYRRIKQVLGSYDASVMERIVDQEGDDDGGWVATHGTVGAASDSLPITAEEPAAKVTTDEKPGAENDEDSDAESLPPVDLDEFVNSAEIEDPDPANAMNRQSQSLTAAAVDNVAVERVRTYDLYITYDNYYHTPRMWLVGYSENKRLLSQKEMFEDISEEHADKTVTMECHPHLPGQVTMASIHPCKHAEVMKRLIEAMFTLEPASISSSSEQPSSSTGGESQVVGVHLYLIVFLKFMQAVIPTIEYDFTRDVKMK